MISTNRILIKRLSAAPTTLQRIGRSQNFCSREAAAKPSIAAASSSRRDSRTLAQQQLPHPTTINAFRSNAFFSSTATELPEESGDSLAKEDDSNDGLNEKDDKSSTEEEATTENTYSTDGASKKDGVPPSEDISTKTADSIDSKNSNSKYDGVPPEEVIRKGVIKWIDYNKFCGVFIQDEEYRNIGPAKGSSNIFFHFFDFYPEQHLSSFGKDLVKPAFSGNARFQFQARAEKGSRNMRGFNVRYEGGEDITLLNWDGALAAMRRSKAQLGHEVYDILSSNSVKNEDDMAKHINQAVDRCNKRIKWARGQVSDPKKVAAECKAKLGEEIYDLLTNIATENDVARKADEAYFRCLKDLSALELNFSPEETFGDDEETSKKEKSFQEYFERSKKK